jgi:hypothetical protein
VKVTGHLGREELDRVVKEVKKVGDWVDKVVVGGPGNSLTKHGSGTERGYHPERTVKVLKDSEGRVKGMDVRFHLTDPDRLSMGEKRELVDRTVDLVKRIKLDRPETQVTYVTMFPRYLERCCSSPGHMTEEDAIMVNGFRKMVDREIVEELSGMVGVDVVEWWRLMGWEKEGTVEEMEKRGVVGSDGVHLTKKACSFAAVSLVHRLAEKELMGMEEESLAKRRRR